MFTTHLHFSVYTTVTINSPVILLPYLHSPHFWSCSLREQQMKTSSSASSAGMYSVRTVGVAVCLRVRRRNVVILTQVVDVFTTHHLLSNTTDTQSHLVLFKFQSKNRNNDNNRVLRTTVLNLSMDGVTQPKYYT